MYIRDFHARLVGYHPAIRNLAAKHFLDRRRDERGDDLDAAGQYAPHAPAPAGPARAGMETNFRRAMENSMLTGMRALDMEGRITYVNRAFCNMTG